MPYAEERSYEGSRTVRILHETGGVWSIIDGAARASTLPGQTVTDARAAGDRAAGVQASGPWRTLVELFSDGDDLPCLVNCTGTMRLRSRDHGVFHAVCDVDETHVQAFFPEGFRAGLSDSAFVRRFIEQLPAGDGRPVQRGLPPMPAGIHRLWCVASLDKQCIGVIGVGDDAIADLASGVDDFPRAGVAAVGLVSIAKLGPPYSRPGLHGGRVIVQEVDASDGTSNLEPFETEAEALSALENHRASLVRSGWKDRPLEPELDPD